ncbi:PTS transporter subunit IIC [Enterococcus cecorum]
MLGGLLTMVIMGLIGSIVIIPVAVPYFFIGATAGVFGNATGGWKGCIARFICCRNFNRSWSKHLFIQLWKILV